MKTNISAINRLFAWMRLNYGSWWVMQFNGVDLLAAGKEQWLEELKKFNDYHVIKALKVVKEIYPGKPPTLEQFAALVSNQKNSKAGHESKRTFMTEPGIRENKAGDSVGKSYLDKIREDSLS